MRKCATGISGSMEVGFVSAGESLVLAAEESEVWDVYLSCDVCSALPNCLLLLGASWVL